MSNHLNKDWLAVLRDAAIAGKRAIRRNYDFHSRNMVVKRGVGGDLTLKIDEASEKAIHNSLNRNLGRNSFVFVSEELGEPRVNDDSPRPIVICDPLDGSHNAQVGIPFFAVSLSVIGLHRKLHPSDPRKFGDVDAALILSVRGDDEYSAIKHEGAFLNGSRLKASPKKHGKINTILLETGDIDYMKRYLMRRLTKKLVYKTRILGSAALSYCLLADGSADALIFAQPGGARTIDSPAGYLIARESGCFFSDLSGKQEDTDEIEVGFHSRANLVGSPSKRTMQKLRKLVHTP